MKLFTTIFLTLLLTFAIFAAGDPAGATEPMRLFNNFRKAAIEENTFEAQFLAGGDLLNTIKKSGFPRELRNNLIGVETAVEDVFFRRQNPTKAAVYARCKVNNQTKILKIELGYDSTGVLKVLRMVPGTPVPDAMIPIFAAACQHGDLNSIKKFLAPQLAAELTAIPPLLTWKEIPEIRKKSLSGKKAVFELEYSRVTGMIELTLNDLIWEITAIDPVFSLPMPDDALNEFFAISREYLRETRKAQWEEKYHQVEDQKKTLRLEKYQRDVRRFFHPSKLDSLLADLNEQQISCFANFPEILECKASAARIKLTLKLRNETQKGTCRMEMLPRNGHWQISRISFSLQDAAEERLVARLLAAWNFDRKMNPEHFNSREAMQEWENKLGEIDFSDVIMPENFQVTRNGSSVTVRCTLRHKNHPQQTENLTFSLISGGNGVKIQAE